MKEGKTPLGVVFDIGGVLLSFDHMKACKAIGARCAMSAEEVYERVFTSGLEASYDRGMPTGEFYGEVSKRLAIKAPFDVPPDEFGLLWSDIFEENPGIEEVVRTLSGMVRLFILSNTNPLHYEFAAGRFPFLNDCFEAAFLSYEIGEGKPSPVIYRTVVEKTGLKPEELFYIDDREEHVEAAKALGIRSLRFTSIEALKERLKGLGLGV